MKKARQMRLTVTQKILWAAVGVVLAGYGVLAWMNGGRNSGTAVTMEQTFRPEFTLTDATGRPITSGDFAGRFQLVFFGFTNCPDICPTTLAEVAAVIEALGSDADRVQPLFISVDPERDAGSGLAAYTAAFHPAILGLAGSAEATRAAASSFKIAFEKEPQGETYTMAHSAALYLIGPDGDWLRLFDYGTPAADITADLKSRL